LYNATVATTNHIKLSGERQRGAETMNSGLIREFRITMRKVQRSLGWLSKNDAACCGITVAQCHALLEIGSSDGIALNDLASALNLDTSTISRTIDNMVRDSLVERKANPDDRRYVDLSLTDTGQKIFDDINSTFDQFYADLFHSIPTEKHQQVIESIDLLAKALSQTKNNTCCKRS
jgi:DNA-binding MarR family transcriptional regulator